jgi:signal transduction histidine kinase
MNRLIDDLLDVARLDIGALPLDGRQCSAESLVQEVCDLFHPLASSKAIVLHGQVTAMLPTFSGDRERLLRVLSNLIANAIKFTPPRGSVRVEAFPSPAGIRFMVADSGPGIPKELQAHVFERFWQADRPGRSSGGGVGLGLSVAKTIVEGHGGHLWVESESGLGCQFMFDLPFRSCSGRP